MHRGVLTNMLYLDLVFFILFSIVLVKSSTVSVRALIKIAHYFRLNEFIISFILFGVASSLPETLISVESAIRKIPEIGAGTLIGGNIADLTLVIGIVAIYARNIKIKSNMFKWDMFYLLLCGLPLLLSLDGQLSRIDGAILIIFFMLYFNFIISNRQKYKTKIVEYVNKKQLHKNITIFIVGFIFLVVSSNLIVDFASRLAIEINVPIILIALLLLALGTTLPELTFSLNSINQGHKELGLGDILGVVIVDSTFVLGLTALIYPIAISKIVLVAATIMFISAIIAILLMESDGELDWKEGITAVILYIIALIVMLSYQKIL